MKCKKLRMESRWRGPCLVAAAAFLVSMTSGSLSATPVSGTGNINGTVTVGTSGIQFFNNLGVPNLFLGAPSNGSYTGLTGGTIDNLAGPPVVGAISIPDFATFFVPTGNVFFDLQNIFAGVGTAANCANNNFGSVCTPPGSPFTLTQTPTGVTVTLAMSGIAYTGTSSSGSSPTGGLFTAQVTTPGFISEVLAEVANNTLLKQTYSASFTSTPLAPVPEPATSGLIGTALLGLGLLKSRRARS
jgi:hypothetical protein